MDIIRYASENGGETFTLFQPQMGTGDMLMNAGTVMLVVFGVLFLMYILISLSGKVIAGISGRGSSRSSSNCLLHCEKRGYCSSVTGLCVL